MIKHNILFVNDAYFKKFLPDMSMVNSSKINAVIRRIQVTYLIDLLSSSIYNHLYDLVDTDTVMSDEEQELFESIQLFLAMKAEVILASNDTKLYGDSTERKIASLQQELKVVTSRILTMVSNSAALSAIAENSTNDNFKGNQQGNESGGFYFG